MEKEVFSKENIYFRKKKYFQTESFGLHWHDYIEIELIAEGSMYQSINGDNAQLLTDGYVSILRPTVFHSVEVLSNTTLYSLELSDENISNDILQSLVLYKDNIIVKFTNSELKKVTMLFELLSEEYVSKQPNARIIKKLIDCIVISIIQKNDVSILQPNTDDHSFESGIYFLKTHFFENPSLDKIAELLGYNSCYFSYLFHKKTGMCFSDYLNILKVNYAKKLLLSTNISIAEISKKCGFGSVNNFSRVFKFNTHLTPQEYRLNSRENEMNISANY